jgi:hypothetical protein
MKDQWYYARTGKSYGPITFSILQEQARTGYLLPSDLVWVEGMMDWMPARSVEGLFPIPPPVQFSEIKTTYQSKSRGHHEFSGTSHNQRRSNRIVKEEKSRFISIITAIVLMLIIGVSVSLGWIFHALQPRTPLQKFADLLSQPPSKPNSVFPSFDNLLSDLNVTQSVIKSATVERDIGLNMFQQFTPVLSFDVSVFNTSKKALSEVSFYVRYKEPDRSIPEGDLFKTIKIPSGIEPGETRSLDFVVPYESINFKFGELRNPVAIIEIAIVPPSDVFTLEKNEVLAKRYIFTKATLR